MKIIIGADHHGFKLKQKLVEYLNKKGYKTEDIGSYSSDNVNYTEFAFEVGKRVSNKEFNYGILICGTGIGMMIAANKVNGIRAANPKDTRSARLSREHNDANVLVFDEKIFLYKAKDIVDVFLATSPSKNQRYINRNKQLAEYEGSTYEL